MPKENVALLAFNRGEVDKRALSRVDIDRISMSAEVQVNYMPRRLGSMMLRPGLGDILGTKNNNKAAFLSFKYAENDKALLEITDSVMRVVINDSLVTRSAVNTAIVNGGFAGGIAGWTVDDDAGCDTTWVANGVVKFKGNNTGYAKIKQTVVLSGSGQHAIRLRVIGGVVRLRVSSLANVDYFSYLLTEGYHSLSFTPTANFVVEIGSLRDYESFCGQISIEPAGVLELPVIWKEEDLPYIRYAQSNDVIFVACKNKATQKIERRSSTSWSIVDFKPIDGPFRDINATSATIAADKLSGDVILTASERIFKTSQIGGLIKLVSSGQTVQANIASDNVFTNSVRITGVSSARYFTVNISDVWTGTVFLQRSDDDITWVDVSSYSSNTTITYSDGLDNQTLYYRAGVKTGIAVTGNINVTISFSGGSIDGIARITSCSDSSLTATARVLKPLGSTSATADWYEGVWSGRRDYPSSVAIYEDRLWLAGKNNITGSVSGAYYGTLESFDESVDGDSGVIKRELNGGDVVHWLLSLNRLMIGTGIGVFSCRSTSFDEPLTPGNFNIKPTPSTKQPANIDPAVIDSRGIYVNGSLFNISQLGFDERTLDYAASDLTSLNPDIGKPGIVSIGIQREPDTRIHCVLADGTVAIMLTEPLEEVSCWVRVVIDAFVEGVIIQPGIEEDSVYYQVSRGGVRRLWKWAKESEAIGGQINKISDGFVYASGSSNSISGLDHLEGSTVVAWGNGRNLGSHLVVNGSISLPETATHRCAGLPYSAKYKSSKLSYAAGLGTALLQKKKINQLGLIMSNCHAQGVKYGKDFNRMFALPKSPNWVPIDQNSVISDYDEESFPFGGEWDTDSRLCLQSEAPNPCTICAAIVSVQTNDKV